MSTKQATYVAVIVACAVVIGWLMWPSQRYYRSIGDHEIRIRIGSDEAGSTQMKIHASYSKKWAIMWGYTAVPLPPDFQSPKFVTIEDDTSNLVCVYDANGCGFIMIVDRSDHDWYVGGKNGGSHLSSMEKWRAHFRTLRKKHPEIPYEWYFDDDDAKVPIGAQQR